MHILPPRLRRAPLRVRLAAGFVTVMLAVLAAAGAFVYWRVQVALDRSLRTDLDRQSADLQHALSSRPGSPREALATLPGATVLDQVLDAGGTVLASTPAAGGPSLLRGRDLNAARLHAVGYDAGHLLLDDDRRLRVRAYPVPGAGERQVVAVTAVRLAQRDEALRELLAQLTVANLAALVIASLVGYRLARAALQPVDTYRLQAEQIADGATGVRLDVPSSTDDEITRLGHTLNRMLTAQERAASQQRQFLADASHELRSPLTLLTSEVELALRRPRTAAEHEQTLRHIGADTSRLVHLTDQLLDLERSGTGLANQALASTDLQSAVRRAARRGTSALTGTPRQVAVGELTAVQVAASAEQLDMVLGNLIDNAVTHGDGTVRITAAVADRHVLVQISDEGPGLPTELIPHAIDRFRRADTARTTPGSGLGLALVHRVLTGLGGELRLCTAGTHHRYPPILPTAIACSHPATGTPGTTATAALPLTSAT